MSEYVEVLECHKPTQIFSNTAAAARETAVTSAAAATFYPAGTRCVVTCPDHGRSQGTTVTRYCDQQGHWNGPVLHCVVYEVGNSSEAVQPRVGELGKPRQKRFIGWIFLGILVARFLCKFFCKRDVRRPPPDVNPPEISCPTRNSYQYFALKGKTEVQVTWEAATAKDRECGNNVRVIKLSPPENSGSMFLGDPDGITYDIVYVAQDCHGNANLCQTEFQVIVQSCRFPKVPYKGERKCDFNGHSYPVWGSTCQYSCEQGYILKGQYRQTCQEDGSWSDNPVICQKKFCPTPNKPRFTERLRCTDGYGYGSVCIFICMAGFKKKTGGKYTTMCQDNQEWSEKISDCEDAEEPTFTTCPYPIRSYADRSKDTKVVSWNPPTAEDTADGTVTPVLKVGRTPGSEFSVGVHEIVYTATDSKGNEAVPCAFSVNVQQLQCPLLPYSNRLITRCPNGIIFGATCTFECKHNYLLIGLIEVTCEETSSPTPSANWDWLSQQPTTCDVVSCPNLSNPANGTLNCQTWLHGSTCELLCNPGYDIPRGYQGIFTCDDTKGWWAPDIEVPDCSESQRSESSRLQSEVNYYFASDCSSDNTKEQIKQSFNAALQHSSYQSACTQYSQCRAGYTEVFCSALSGRKKRSLIVSYDPQNTWAARKKRATANYQALVKFDFHLSIPKSTETGPKPPEILKSQEETYDDMINIVRQEMIQGRFNMTNVNGFLNVDPGSLRSDYLRLVCEEGQEPRASTLNCVGCPGGTHFDADTDSCVPCPVGTYQDQDSQFQCKSCPSGKSTLQGKTKSAAMCIDLCPKGTYSDTGLVSKTGNCIPCSLNSYQDEPGQTSCKQCPASTFTVSTRSSEASHCLSQAGCSPDPCHGHPCKELPVSGFQCTCKSGYSGKTCNIPPNHCDDDPCLNEATCENSHNSFSCVCKTGYRGRNCEQVIVNGGWESWSPWSPCSASCEGGTQTRSRSCTNPKPDYDGKPCEGDSQEILTCNNQTCPVCPELVLENGNFKNCTWRDAMIECTLSCKPGFLFPQPPVSSYFCGPKTGYVWSHQINDKHAKLPRCLVATPPSKVNITSKMEVEGLTCPQDIPDSTDIKLEFRDNQTPCVQNGRCKVINNLSHCNKRNKRSGEVTLLNTILVEVDVSSFPTADNFDETQAEEWIVEYVYLLEDMTNYALSLNESVSDGSLQINVDGQSFKPNTTNLQQEGHLRCELGAQTMDIMCLSCWPGTYDDDGHCRACPHDEFQDTSGQTSCKKCPQGTKTTMTGAKSQKECIRDNGSIAIIILATLVPVFSILGIIGIILSVRIQKRNRTTTGKEVTKECPTYEEIDTTGKSYINPTYDNDLNLNKSV